MDVWTEIKKFLLKYVLGGVAAVAALVFLRVDSLQNSLTYLRPEIAGALGLGLLVLVAKDAATAWSSKDLLPRLLLISGIKYLATILVFLLISSWGTSNLLEGQGPSIAAGLMLIIAETAGLQAFIMPAVKQATLHDSVGFAATGLLVLRRDSGSETFLLLMNKNLRGGEGLWVPPGGHYVPYLESPFVKLQAKIQAETGYKPELWHPYDMGLIGDQHEMRIGDGVWYPPPAFFLREDLKGRCSYGHREHLDFVYICVARDKASNNHKYSESQSIHIPVLECVESREAAERAAAKQIDEWSRTQHGRLQSSRDDLPTDVVLRLHLAAKAMHQSGDS